MSELRYCEDPRCVDERGDRSIVDLCFEEDMTYWECPECGYIFGYEKVKDTSCS